MLYKEFYSELGKLLYAVADVDKMISEKEKKILQDIVKKELVPNEKHADEFGTDAAFYSEIEFDYNDEQIIDTESAFNSFIEFIEDHHSAIDEKMKNVCIHIVNEIAGAYRGTNKKEKKLIKLLKHKLESIKPRISKNPIKKVGVDPLFSSEPKFDYLEEEPVESESTNTELVDIIDEHEHVFDDEVGKQSKRIEKKFLVKKSNSK